MKDKYKWYIDPRDDEIGHIWDEGILTLDTNVLLDLYRYHEDTQNALLGALELFKGRVWLTHQTAEEFFRNRKKVIVSAKGSFKEAEGNIGKIRKDSEEPLNALKSNRIVSDSIADKLRDSIEAALDVAKHEVDDAQASHNNYLESDPILEKLLELFDGKVGDAFDDKELEVSKEEAKRRIENRIPPGYLDSKKDGVRPYGDYFIWRQVLNYSKKKKLPFIFVTSETKEDWFEKISGRTVGIQYELQKEAYEQTKQRILFYRTDRFLEFATERTGNEANESAVQEIRLIAKERASNAPTVRMLDQVITIATTEKNIGLLMVQIMRPTRAFTCSGHLEPKMVSPPSVAVDPIDYPSGTPPFEISAGTGTTFDFNIHVKSLDKNELLPPGVYLFDYTANAIIEAQTINIED